MTQTAKRPWTEKETKYLLRHAGKKPYIDIAMKLTRTERSVAMKAMQLGVQGLNRNWTAEEDELVLDSLGNASIAFIAKRLGRSPGAVTKRLERLGVGNLSQEAGAYRTYELADILGVDPTTVLAWIQDKGLPAKRHHETKDDDRKRYHHVFAEDFWKWAQDNPRSVHFGKIKRASLLPEPDWLDNAIASETKAPRHQAEWTTGEDRRLVTYAREKKTQLQIGELLGRSRRAVQKRIAYLRSVGQWPL